MTAMNNNYNEPHHTTNMQ